ncbi:MAG: penicillin-binding protein 2 [bacterium]|nr:penicillin-binding protein 2 [bacterium]
MSNWRINFIFGLLLICGAVITGRLFYLQVVRGDLYKAWAQGMLSKNEQIVGERGEIFFRNGESLAVNADWPLVFASPVEIEEKETVASRVAQALSLQESFVLDKLKKDNMYELIKKRITDQEVQKINEMNLQGIHIGKESGRFYPQETLASQLVGFLAADAKGQYGIEGYYDETLKGKNNQRGRDVFLTVDYSIQFKAEELLEKAKDELGIEGGEIIVMDPASGEILALANYPSFNPNQYSLVSDFSVFKNGITQKIFEPGSIFKPITMAAALEDQKITPQTTYLDKGKVVIGGWTVSNYSNRVYGEQTMTNVLEKSINTGAVFAEQELGNSSFLEYLDKFGFFDLTGVDLPEVYSENREFKKGYEINFVTASFGQGIEITPIQLIRAFSVIANNGKLTNPFIVKKEKQSETEGDSVISPKTAAQLTAMLVSVTENGFAKSARVPGYYIAGKTGTSQISFSALGEDKRGYSDKTWQSFIGFAPAFNPEFVILVKLNNPKTKTAEYSSVPIFQQLAKFIIDYYQIPPDYEIPTNN